MPVERKEVLEDILSSMKYGADWVQDQIANIDDDGAASDQAVHCDEILQRAAINGHLNWRNQVWGQPGWKPLYKELGLRQMRTHMTKPGVADWHEIGAKIIYVATDQDNYDKVQAKANLDLVAATPELISAIEGPNEPNHGNPPNWVADVRGFQQWLYNTVQNNPAIKDKTVISPSIWGRVKNAYTALGDLSAMCDVGNLHWYTGGAQPTTSNVADSDSSVASTLDEALADVDVIAPDLPQAITETGWGVAGPNLPLSAWYVTDLAQAKYNIRMLMEAHSRDLDVCAIYTLIDDVRNPPRYHGLLRQDLSKRFGFGSLKRTLALYNDPVDFELGQLSWKLANEATLPDSITNLPLMQHSNGVFKFTFWNDVPSYDQRTFQDLNPAPVNVTLEFGGSHNYRYMLPTMEWVWVSLPAGPSVTIPVPDHILHLEVT